MDLELRLVRSFVTVVEEGHVGRAAQRLYVSQPALSKQLRRLEAFLEIELFHRAHRGLRLTPAGAVFYDHARELLAKAAESTEHARAAARSGLGTVRVAFVAGLVQLATALLRAAQRELPEVGLELVRVDWRDQADCLHSRRADFSLVRLPIEETGLAHRVLMSEPRVAGFADSHPLARLPEVSLRQLDDEPIIRTSNQQDYWTVNPRPSGAAPILGPLTDSVEEMLAVVSTGACMCITAESLALGYARAGITWVPIPDIGPSNVALAWRADRSDEVTPRIVELAGQVASDAGYTSGRVCESIVHVHPD
ncbi:MAG TPA: LysR family transcriptional regulator [Pseudonocardia sp.]|jgi:DNA-binding transcriptional LysR family regulator